MKKIIIEIIKEENIWKARRKDKPGITSSGNELAMALGRVLWTFYESELKARGIEIKIKNKAYVCKDAIRDIDFYFSGDEGKTTQEQDKALNRALYEHMTLGTVLKKHNIACQKCWDYYQEMKRRYCGG